MSKLSVLHITQNCLIISHEEKHWGWWDFGGFLSMAWERELRALFKSSLLTRIIEIFWLEKTFAIVKSNH